MKMLRKNNGYTLIELLTVISIMGILTAIIYTSFSSAQARSRDQKRVSDVSTIQLALENYFNKNGRYPTSTDVLVPVFLSSIPTPPYAEEGQYNYFPLTKSGMGEVCTSYQLWIRFELSNDYLNSKKGFVSNDLSSFVECGSDHKSVNAKTDKLVYDVMP